MRDGIELIDCKVYFIALEDQAKMEQEMETLSEAYVGRNKYLQKMLFEQEYRVDFSFKFKKMEELSYFPRKTETNQVVEVKVGQFVGRFFVMVTVCFFVLSYSFALRTTFSS